MMATNLDELRRVIRTCPVIDNHAHNLLRLSQLKTTDLLSATSEAEGDALQDHSKTLPHIRAAKQLRKLYGLPKDADWDAILRKRKDLLAHDPNEFIKKCLAGTYTILIDDGLEGSFEDYSWHTQFTSAPCKRILRIEAIAADILSSMHQQGKLPVGIATSDEEACSLAWVSFITAFEQSIATALTDHDVVGFKSVICYRTGLDIHVGRNVEVADAARQSFRSSFLPHCTRTGFRVESKGMCDALVISTCKLIDASYRRRGSAKPFQFHTGLGDNDIALIASNPAHLQPLIKQYPNVPIVLLHSAYPYTREAGYLATVYKNVYLDIGEVFPMVSRDGQEYIIRQALEITPTTKLLWSTDGHFQPETYWLANVQGREAIEQVLCEYVEKDDLTVAEAIEATRAMLFENSNVLYGLHLKLPDMDDDSVPRTSFDSNTTQTTTFTTQQENVAFARDLSKASQGQRNQTQHNVSFLPETRVVMPTQLSTAAPRTIKFVFVQWLDYMAQLRSRWLLMSEFQKLVRHGPGRLSISKGNLGTTQNDHMSAICDPVGSIYVEPDLKSFRSMQSTVPVTDAATVMACFTAEDGAGLTTCPRYTLQRIVEAFEVEYNIELLVGFEIEITFCKRNPMASQDVFTPLDTNHAWGTLSDEQYLTSVGLMCSIAAVLRDIGIVVQQLHSEAGAGQYEFVLPPLPPLRAVDTLIQAKQAIQQIAAAHDLRATCHPLPFPGIGTAAHAHISLNSRKLGDEDIENLERSFTAAILSHLPAICAFTLPQPVSYGRVIDDSWTGGTWIAWGTNNREVPIRRVSAGHLEIRCLDGLANMYLALSAVLCAGLSGLRTQARLEMQDCLSNPTKLSDEQKRELGIRERMPKSLDESLEALERNTDFQEMIGQEVVEIFLSVKKAEQDMLSEMKDDERRVWLMERY